MSARKSSRILVGLALLTGLVFGTSSLAGAHAVLLSMSPEPEAVLGDSPPEVVLAFSEPVSATATAIRVFDPTGAEVSGVKPSVENSVLSAKLPTLKVTGSYTVAWKVVSDDGHVVSGAYLFHLKEATLKTPLEVSDSGVAMMPRVLKAIGSALSWTGLVFVLGMCALAVKGLFARARVLAGLGILSLGTLVSFGGSLLAVGSGLSESLDVALGTNSGRSSLAALVLSLLVLAMSTVLVRATPGPGGSVQTVRAAGHPGPSEATEAIGTARASEALGTTGITGAIETNAEAGSRSTRLAVQIGAALVLIAVALEGHALALSPIAFSAILTVIHVGAAIAWLAGLLWIEQRSRVATPEELADEVRTRSPWAMGLVTALLASGLALLIKRVPLADLLTSGYGRLGSIKLVLLAMAVPLAWMNRSMLTARPSVVGVEADSDVADDEAGTVDDDAGGEAERVVNRFRKSVQVEMLILAAALVVGSVLAQISPPGDAAGVGGGSFSQKLAFGEGQVELTVDPGTRGMNEIHVTTLGPDGRLMAGIEDLAISMSLEAKDIGPLKPAMQQIVPGHSATYARFPFSGQWKVVVSATVEKFTQLTATFDVPIGD